LPFLCYLFFLFHLFRGTDRETEKNLERKKIKKDMIREKKKGDEMREGKKERERKEERKKIMINEIRGLLSRFLFQGVSWKLVDVFVWVLHCIFIKKLFGCI
jgi:hypothetical protein